MWFDLDVRTIWPVYPLKNMVAVDGRVYGALFSHDESRILTWSDDGTARLWDARTGQPLGPALQHKGSVTGALFSHDESRILTWSDDGTARIWPIKSTWTSPRITSHCGSEL
jgi:WD40 repeat protein